MKMRVLGFAMVLLQVALSGSSVFGHPGTGIVVDKEGNVYFIYSGVGVAKISIEGNITFIHKATDGHWMCLDEQGIFSRTHPKYFERITPIGSNPAIIFAGGGSPIIIGGDGNFYYCGGQKGDLNPGGKSLVREKPDQQPILFAPTLENILDKLDDGITGLAAAPDCSIYAAGWNSLLKITMDGNVISLVHPVKVSDCIQDPADHREANRGKPLLRGIDVDSAGAVYAAATSCHCLLKISSDGKVKTILKAEGSWSPTGVAVRNGNIYVLEYTNANGPATEGWLPRVRKIGRDGRITLIADFSKKLKM